MKAVFFGSCEFSLVSFKKILKNENISQISLVCPPPPSSSSTSLDTLCTSSSPLYRYASTIPNVPIYFAPKSHSLKTFTLPPPSTTPSTTPTINNTTTSMYDVGIVVSFGYFIPSRIISMFKYGMINLHPSLLPMYRGSAPIQHSLLNGDSKSGISIIKVHPSHFDAGDILLQVPSNISKSDTFLNVHDKLARLGALHLDRVLYRLPFYLSLAKPQQPPQHHNHQSSSQVEHIQKAPKISRKNALVVFSNDGVCASSIWNKYRALSHTYTLHSSTFSSPTSKFYSQLPFELHLLDIRPPFEKTHELQLLNMKVPMLSCESIAPGSIFLNDITNTLYIRTSHKLSPSISSSTPSMMVELSEAWVGVKYVQASTKLPVSASAFFTSHNLENFSRIFI